MTLVYVQSIDGGDMSDCDFCRPAAAPCDAADVRYTDRESPSNFTTATNFDALIACVKERVIWPMQPLST
ncbi:MAG: hypothetical protein ACRDID_04165, partial [Ktedonobacterales bacterium]